MNETKDELVKGFHSTVSGMTEKDWRVHDEISSIINRVDAIQIVQETSENQNSLRAQMHACLADLHRIKEAKGI